MNVHGVHHVGFTVSDLDRSIEFYARFGFVAAERFEVSGRGASAGTGVPDARYEIVFLRRPGFILELIQYANDGATRPPRNQDVGSAHVCLRVDDVVGLYETLLAEGVPFYGPPCRQEAPGVTWVYMRDPDGITVELLEIHADAS
jgi:catechol 2,3-dioxygenase-like lactoylglutathione lyase family enzyme